MDGVYVTMEPIVNNTELMLDGEEMILGMETSSNSNKIHNQLIHFKVVGMIQM